MSKNQPFSVLFFLVFFYLVSCKARFFNSSLSGTDGSSRIVSFAKKSYEPGQKVMIYVHGRSPDGNLEPFLGDFEKTLEKKWADEGFASFAFLWPQLAKDTLPPDAAEARIWTQVGTQLMESVKAELRNSWINSRRPEEIRIVCHSLGCQLATILVWRLSKNEELRPLLRFEMLDPYFSSAPLPASTPDDLKSKNAVEVLSNIKNMFFELKERGVSPPVIYGASVMGGLGFYLNGLAHLQQTHPDWLFGAEKGDQSTLTFQHSQVKPLYFSSINEASPALSNGMQAFSAALPSLELISRKRFMVLNQTKGLESKHFREHAYDLSKSYDDNGALPSSEVARNVHGVSGACESGGVKFPPTGGAPTATDCHLSPEEEIEAELQRLKADMASGVKSTPPVAQSKPASSEVLKPNKYDQFYSEAAKKKVVETCGKWRSVDEFLQDCVTAPENSNFPLMVLNSCFGFKSPQPLGTYKTCANAMRAAYHPDLVMSAPEDLQTAHAQATQLINLWNAKSKEIIK